LQRSNDFLRKELCEVQRKLNIVRTDAESKEGELERTIEMWKEKCLQEQQKVHDARAARTELEEELRKVEANVSSSCGT
jgi:hypothetical protein